MRSVVVIVGLTTPHYS